MDTLIITSVKETLNISPEDPSFDSEILPLINSGVSILSQIINVEMSEVVDKDSKWEDFFEDVENEQFVMSQQYIYLYVKLLFDPPPSSTTFTHFQSLLDMLAFRMVTIDE